MLSCYTDGSKCSEGVDCATVFNVLISRPFLSHFTEEFLFLTTLSNTVVLLLITPDSRSALQALGRLYMPTIVSENTAILL